METARFVPPDVPAMTKSLHNWETYIHKEDKDPMVQLAIIHAQFEVIHPFLDGNGRIGRILIPLFLYHKEIIREPVFYMSDYLESNRSEYYDALKNITDHGGWVYWIRFFLNGVIRQAEKNINQTRAIIDLYEQMKIKITDEIRSQYVIQCLDFIFNKPIFNSGDFKRGAGIPTASAMRLIKAMEDSHIITCLERGSGRRPARCGCRKPPATP
jgi:Fic family protein